MRGWLTVDCDVFCDDAGEVFSDDDECCDVVRVDAGALISDDGDDDVNDGVRMIWCRLRRFPPPSRWRCLADHLNTRKKQKNGAQANKYCTPGRRKTIVRLPCRSRRHRGEDDDGFTSPNLRGSTKRGTHGVIHMMWVLDRSQTSFYVHQKAAAAAAAAEVELYLGAA